MGKGVERERGTQRLSGEARDHQGPQLKHEGVTYTTSPTHYRIHNRGTRLVGILNGTRFSILTEKAVATSQNDRLQVPCLFSFFFFGAAQVTLRRRRSRIRQHEATADKQDSSNRDLHGQTTSFVIDSLYKTVYLALSLDQQTAMVVGRCGGAACGHYRFATTRTGHFYPGLQVKHAFESRQDKKKWCNTCRSM